MFHGLQAKHGFRTQIMEFVFKIIFDMNIMYLIIKNRLRSFTFMILGLQIYKIIHVN